MLLIPAYAKVNLALAVRRRRPDGFHDIDSVAVTIDWHDLVGLSAVAAAATSIRFRVTSAAVPRGGRRRGRTGAEVDVPAGDDNLALRAAHAIAAWGGPVEIDLWLDKRIPTQAGLGGGSADAAAVLRVGTHALPRGFTPPSAAEMLALSASLGSDVPMLLAGGAQRVGGRGEVLTPISAPALHLAVAIAGTSATAATYAATREYDHDDSSRIASVAAALTAGRIPDDDDLGSGLEAPACRANGALDEGLTALRAAIPEVRWHLTGSGGAAFALAADAAHAEELAGAAREYGLPSRACRTVGDAPSAILRR